MRVPLSWLREYAEVPADEPARAVADRLTAAGLKVESLSSPDAALHGPLKVGRVLSFTEETHRNGKTVRWCEVDVGEVAPRGIVCGARNFASGDPVVVALPGAVLPGGFAISARRTYGHVSDGMICSTRELGIGDDHAGILVLAGSPQPGSDAVETLNLRDEVLELEITPDRGYALSLRGVARELAGAYGTTFRDPAELPVTPGPGACWPVRVDDPACDHFVVREVHGFDPAAPSPDWLRQRLSLAGVRPVSLAVDVTNYVMLELGQPIHGYDRARLTGAVVVRRALPGESLTTLDGVERRLDPGDLLIADDSGPLGLAGVMGGMASEMSGSTTDVVVEAAHFDPVAVARTSRRHRLSTEASRRFERGVDPELPAAAAQRVVDLLVELGGGAARPGVTSVRAPRPGRTITIPADRPGRVAGRELPRAQVVRRLEQVGCRVTGDDVLVVTPPPWRPDLRDPADLDEEVLRLEGYDTIPATLPSTPAGRGLTSEQRLWRRAGRALAAAGYVETPTFPFVGPAVWEALGIPRGDRRRHALRVANPLSDEEPELRTTLLPGLLTALRRNVGRGQPDLALFEVGTVFLPRPDAAPSAPRLPVDRRPTPGELAAIEAALPDQPRHVAVALCGDRESRGWWGDGRPAGWADAVEAARLLAGSLDAPLVVRRGDQTPWHPGRCAALLLDGRTIGHAGELHPAAVQALGLPPRTAAMELDLDALVAAARPLLPAPSVSPFPVAKEDVALVLDAGVPAADVAAALRDGAGDLLESVRLFDVYTGAQVGEGRRSLAFSMRFRAPDRTLTEQEVSAARDAAVAEASRRTGAVLRGV